MQQMTAIDVTCFKGTGTNEKKVYRFAPEEKLREVRRKLNEDQFLQSDDKPNKIGYRFIKAQSDSTTFEDAVMGTESEPYVPVQDVLGKENQLILTNIYKQKETDLVGIATKQFFNRYLSVEISLNNGDPEARRTNQAIKAFAPLMLTDVMPTSKEATGLWDNVCVCVNDSVVQFSISSWGSAGYELKVVPDAGEPIAGGGLYACLGIDGRPLDSYSSMGLSRYADRPNSIQIKGTESLGIPNGHSFKYQKVVFTTRRITSYKLDNGKIIQSSSTRPPRPASRQARSLSVSNVSEDLSIRRNLVLAQKSLSTIYGDTIKPGAPTEGPESQQQFAGGISDVQVSDWTDALGAVVIYFFVFKDWETANATINSLNSPENFWS